MDKKRRLELIEIYKRRSDDENDDYKVDDETGYEPAKEIDFREMSTEDLMGVLINLHAVDELNFHLASAEAIRRNIDASDVRTYKKIVNCEQCTDCAEIEIIENPQPLVIIRTIDEACLYTDTLDEEGIPYELQIIVDDKDYRKAEMATNNILLTHEDD